MDPGRCDEAALGMHSIARLLAPVASPNQTMTVLRLGAMFGRSAALDAQSEARWKPRLARNLEVPGEAEMERNLYHVFLTRRLRWRKVRQRKGKKKTMQKRKERNTKKHKPNRTQRTQ